MYLTSKQINMRKNSVRSGCVVMIAHSIITSHNKLILGNYCVHPTSLGHFWVIGHLKVTLCLIHQTLGFSIFLEIALRVAVSGVSSIISWPITTVRGA